MMPPSHPAEAWRFGRGVLCPLDAMRRRVQLEVDLGVVRDNYARIARLVSPCAVMAVLKANAYGTGVRPVAGALAAAGVARIAVAELNEAGELADLHLPIHILGGVLADEIPGAVELGLVLPVADLETARSISEASGRQRRLTRVHVLVDTGMGRLGVLAGEAEALVQGVAALPHLQCEGIYTHFPVAYHAGGAFTQRQIDVFRALLARLASGGIRFPCCHVANSDAIHNFPQTYSAPFNMVRTGINLYGCYDAEGNRTLELRPALTLTTRLTAVREMPSGMNISYGCTYTTPRAMTVGVISAGYADGLPLALSNRGHVLIRGRPCPVLGRVSMDYTVVDLAQVPEARAGDEVVCLGGEGPARITVDHWAQLKGTHPYEIICSIGGRVERCYSGGG